MTSPDALHLTLVVLLVLSTSLWFGGFATIAVVASVARRSLDELDRVRFFRALGRTYLWVGGSALAVALASGVLLLNQRGWDALAIATAVAAAALVALLVVAVAQARRMSRLRQRALTETGDESLQRLVVSGGRAAGALRGLLGLLSVALVVLGCVLAAG